MIRTQSTEASSVRHHNSPRLCSQGQKGAADEYSRFPGATRLSSTSPQASSIPRSPTDDGAVRRRSRAAGHQLLHKRGGFLHKCWGRGYRDTGTITQLLPEAMTVLSTDSALQTLSRAAPVSISQVRKPGGILGATQQMFGRADLESELLVLHGFSLHITAALPTLANRLKAPVWSPANTELEYQRKQQKRECLSPFHSRTG